MKNYLKFGLLCLLICYTPMVTSARQKPKAPTDTAKKVTKVAKDTSKKAIQPPLDATKKTTKVGADSAIAITLKAYSAPRVFNSSVRLTECTINGTKVSSPNQPTAMKGQGFNVTAIAPDGRLVLRMWKWTLKKDLDSNLSNLDSAAVSRAMAAAKTKPEQEKIVNQIEIVSRREALNFKLYGDKAYAFGSLKKEGDNTYYFIMSKDSVDQLSSVSVPTSKWDATFGVLTTPFKIRYRRFAFSNNAGIGTAVFIQKKVNTHWSYGWVPGISLTSVTLDAASTTVHSSSDPKSSMMSLSTSTTRPAFTPSMSFMLAYKTINFTLGVGCDYIAKPTDVATTTNPEAGWIYNGKPWIGIGFGVSLFGNNSNSSATPVAGKQKPN